MAVITSGFIDSTPLLNDPEALKKRAEQDSFLFFKGLLPREDVLNVRRKFLTVLDEYNWLDRSHDLMDGYLNREQLDKEDPVKMNDQGVGIHNEAYIKIQKIYDFHKLAHHPRILGMYRSILGGDVMPHPRHIARLIFPTKYTKPTPPHQDFIHIQGTKNVWTMWMPVGDCPMEMGNLTAIRGSARDGLLPVAAAEGAGGLESHLCADQYEWVQGDFEAGDVLTFPSLTVHKALTPSVLDRVRMSMDFRFQRSDEEIEPASLRPHGDITTWDEIYSDWDQDDLKYYWKDKEFQFSEFDESIRWQKEKIC